MKKFNINKLHYYLFFGILGVFIIFFILFNWNFGNDKNIKWGVTFSKLQAESLELDWRLAYYKTINELPIKVVRMPIYWTDVETRPGVYDFSDYIWMVNEAHKNNIEIVPVLGRRVPRWPECHTPKFYSNLEETEIQDKILSLINAEINHFKNYANIKKWQIDNEPFLDVFGECPNFDENFYKKELALVKNLDNRQILITESGELSSWLKGGKLGDILGVSMYRQTWNKNWGYFRYPIWPVYYFFKAQIVKQITGVENIINTELQVEPWAINHDFTQTELFDQFYSMDLPQVKENIKFAKRSGLQEVYLWGVEWWWWLGQKHNMWEYWEYAKTIQ
jgi:hypothetical protein